MKLKITTDNSPGKYIAITKKGNTLVVNRTAKKPRGGAKATLEKIQKILEVTEVDDQSKTSLGKISAEIDSGYAKKNDKKFLYKLHSKKVHKVADRIAALTMAPEIPADVFSVLGSFVDRQTLGRLAQVNKAAASAGMDWSRRAMALGWPGEGDPKAFCKGITKELDKLGLHSIANQLISHPEMDLDLKTLTKIMGRLNYRQPSAKLEPLMHMLVQKTKGFNGPFPINPYNAFFNPKWNTKKIFDPCLYNTNLASTLLPYATLLANLGIKPDLTWFAAADIDKETAKTILDLFPAAAYIKYGNGLSIGPLSEAVAKGNLGWAIALVEKNVNINQPFFLHYETLVQKTPIETAVKNKNTEMISLLTKAGADIPKSWNFLRDLIHNNPSDQALLILNRLNDENYDTYQLMNTRQDWGPPLKVAIEANHSQEVLEKLVEMGAEINPAARGDSPLYYAQKLKKTQAVAWLKDQGAVIPKKQK